LRVSTARLIKSQYVTACAESESCACPLVTHAA
jgi:hypothetical protein